MKISEKTLAFLARVVTGDTHISPYRTGPSLVKFFNEFGSNDVYSSGFPSRWVYAEDKIRDLNDTPLLVNVFTSVLDPRDYLNTDFSPTSAAQELNKYLKYDGYELVKHGDLFKVSDLGGNSVDINLPAQGFTAVSHLFIEDQIQKCDSKIIGGDFGGAITNARSLLEAVLLEIEGELSQAPKVSYDGDLPSLWKRVLVLFNLDVSRKDVADGLRQTLGGLTSTVVGIATLRNKISDTHGTNYMASKRHAKLAVNASKTVADFIIETYLEGQENKLNQP